MHWQEFPTAKYPWERYRVVSDPHEYRIFENSETTGDPKQPWILWIRRLAPDNVWGHLPYSVHDTDDAAINAAENFEATQGSGAAASREANRVKLFDNGFVYAGTDFVKCLACFKNVYVGETEDLDMALAHKSECPAAT
jgi:hypothetical protein